MEKIYLSVLFQLIIFLCFSIFVNAQYAEKQNPHIHDHRCGTMELDAYSRQRFPERGTLDEFERWLNPLVEEYKEYNHNHRLPILTIPVIFHIITDGNGAENLSTGQVQAQLDQLNIDFRDLAGSTNAVRGDCEIEFCLATLDPADNVLPEPGINRVTTFGDGPFASGTVDNNIKPATSWDPNNYMNIWVADLTGGLLGWAQFPDASGLAGLNANGGAANTDGVVILYSAVGSVANPFPGGGPYNLGRTLTHEVGHWIGLRHIWGDGGCNVDDFCGDTPASNGSNFGCPNVSNCSSLDMVQNYMDYTDDGCMNIFTADQKARVRTVMATSPRRSSLPNSTKCGVAAPIISFASGGAVSINELTDCSYQDFVIDLNISAAPSANATVTFNVVGTTNGTLGSDFDFFPASVVFPAGSTPTRQLTIRVFNDGIVEPSELVEIDFTVTTSGDAIAATGDLLNYDITIQDDDQIPSGVGSVVILAENFDSGNLGNFSTQGNNGSDRFLIGNTTASNSAWWTIATTNTSQFAYSNDDNCNCNKANDRLTSPVFSLVGAYTSASLVFDHAFANLGSETGLVQLRIGNGNWNTIANLTNNSTGAPGVVTTPWVNGFTVDLTPYIGQPTLRIRFVYNDGSAWEYGMAIDNVQIIGSATSNIQTIDNTAVPDQIPVTGISTVHFYDPTTSDVMGTIQNLSTWDYQCTTVEVDRDAIATAGPTAPFWDNNPANALAAKTFFISPSNNNPTGTYTVTLYYTDAEITAWENATGKSRSALKIVKVANNPISNVNSSTFNNYTIEQIPATIGAFGSDVTLTATFNTGFSGFGIGDPGSAPVILLPMELISFTGLKKYNDAILSWETKNEDNVDFYLLERSIDGVNFEVLNKQKAKGNGLINTIFKYHYLDINPNNSFNYYRLAQVDLNGNKTYSKIIVISFIDIPAPVMTFSPNPVKNLLMIDYRTSLKGDISIEVYDLIGQPIINPIIDRVEVGENNILLDVREYPRGIYLMRIQQGSIASIKRFVKQ
ncbi:MAG: T9SS type A sorting domain-containing protein [Saprospiraceae bacterium]|nr:T9SS type A sorting domain-containing protein [Saprospiraceae bacterium]